MRRSAVLLRGITRPSPQGNERPSLTERRLAIVRRVWAGDTDDEIARAFGVTKMTIKNHLGEAYAALGVRGRVEAALWYERHARREDEPRRPRPSLARGPEGLPPVAGGADASGTVGIDVAAPATVGATFRTPATVWQ